MTANPKTLAEMTGEELLAQYRLAIIREESAHPSQPIWERRRAERDALGMELLRLVNAGKAQYAKRFARA